MKKNLLSIVFMLVMLIFGIGQAWAQEQETTRTYTFVPNSATTGSSATSFTNVNFTYQGTNYDLIGWNLNNFIPATRVFRSNFSMSNTTPFPGLITKVEIQFSGAPTNNQLHKLEFTGATTPFASQAAIDEETIDQETIDGGNAQSGVSVDGTTVTWETYVSRSENRYTHFQLSIGNNVFKDITDPKIESISVTYAIVDTFIVELTPVSECGSYTWDKNGKTYTESGTYKDTTSHGTLDTIYKLPLTIYPTYTEITDGDTICASKLPYTWEGLQFTAAGYQTKTLRTVNGCDSTVTFTLTVNQTYNKTAGDSVCYNELPYSWKNANTTVHTFTKEMTTAAGGDLEHTATLQTINGCDSVVTFKLHVFSSFYDVTRRDSVCYNDLPYTWKNGNTTVYEFTAEGDSITTEGGDFEHTATLQTINNCDSVVTFKLHVYQSYNVEDSGSVCYNDLPYTWKNGNTTVYEFSAQGDEITTEGGDFEHTATLKTINNCDSVVTFKLHVYQSYYDIQDGASVCYNELPYENWKNADTTVYTFTKEMTTAAGGDLQHVATLKTINGCDSVVTFKLHVYQSYYDIQDGASVLVEDMPYTWVTGQGDLIFVKDSIKDGKIIRDTLLQSINGCDSLVTFTLVVDTTCGGNRMMKDYESNEYHTALLGHKCWMADNLATGTYADGTTATPSYTIDENVYGRLYSWYTAMKVTEGTQNVTPDAEGYIQGVCPKGWHLPTAEDVEELKDYNVRDLHATTLWPVPGLNRTGLSLIPSGLYNYNISDIQYRDINVYLWTAASTKAAETQMLWTDSHCNMIVVKEENPLHGMAIRCVRNCIHCEDSSNQ